MIPRAKGRRPNSRSLIYDFIVAEIDAGRPFPSRKTIAAYLGWKHDGNVAECLHDLAMRDGKLSRRVIDWPGSTGRRWLFALGEHEEVVKQPSAYVRR